MILPADIQPFLCRLCYLTIISQCASCITRHLTDHSGASEEIMMESIEATRHIEPVVALIEIIVFDGSCVVLARWFSLE